MKKNKKIVLGLMTILITGTVTYLIVDYLVQNGYIKPATDKKVCNNSIKQIKPLNRVNHNKNIIPQNIKNRPQPQNKPIIKNSKIDKPKVTKKDIKSNNSIPKENSIDKKVENLEKIVNELKSNKKVDNNIYVLTTSANLKEGPSYKTKTLGNLKEGDIVTVLEKGNKYYKTDMGYIYNKTLRKLYRTNDKNKIVIDKTVFSYKDRNLKQKDEKLYPGDEFSGKIEGNIVKIVKKGKKFYIPKSSIKLNNNINNNIDKLIEDKFSILDSKIKSIEKIVKKIDTIDKLNKLSKKLKKDILINNRNIKVLNRKITNIELMVKKSVSKMEELSKLIKGDLNNSRNKNRNLIDKKEIEIVKSEIGKLKEQYKILIERNKEFIKEIEKLLNKKEKAEANNSKNSGDIESLKAEPPLLKNSPFTYLGYSLNSDGEKEAYITVDGVDVYKVLKGNIINQRWEVKDIKSDKLILLDNDTKKLVKILFHKKP